MSRLDQVKYSISSGVWEVLCKPRGKNSAASLLKNSEVSTAADSKVDQALSLLKAMATPSL